MAQVLTTSGTAHYIENIIRDAKARVCLVTPYIDISNNLMERLVEASELGKTITIVHGKKRIHPQQVSKLSAIKNIEFYFYKELHAKCYFNESLAIVSSMNLLSYSEKYNRELSIAFTLEQNPIMFNDTIKEINSIVAASKREKYISNEITDKEPNCSLTDYLRSHQKAYIDDYYGQTVIENFPFPYFKAKFYNDAVTIYFDNYNLRDTIKGVWSELENSNAKNKLRSNNFDSINIELNSIKNAQNPIAELNSQDSALIIKVAETIQKHCLTELGMSN